MYRNIEPKKQRHKPPTGIKAYIRVTSRMLYLNNEAMKLLGETETVSISIDKNQRVIIITPGGPWKLTKVHDTKYARRIESGTSMVEILKSGFPYGMLGVYLPCQKDMYGSLVISLIPSERKPC